MRQVLDESEEEVESGEEDFDEGADLEDEGASPASEGFGGMCHTCLCLSNLRRKAD